MLSTSDALSVILKFEGASDKAHTWEEMSKVLDACTVLRIRPSQLALDHANEAYMAQPGLDHHLAIVGYGQGWRLVASLPGQQVDPSRFSNED